MANTKEFGYVPCDCDALHNELQRMKEGLESCKEQKHEDCKKQKEEANAKIATLQKKLVMMQIAAAVAITVIGKEMVDKITEQFAAVQEVQKTTLETFDSPKTSEIEGGGEQESSDSPTFPEDK